MKQHLTLKRRAVEASFRLSFPDEEAARSAGDVLERDGFAVSVTGVLVRAERRVREDSFDVAELVLREVATRFSGEYRGREL
jgi:hypothetical protein